jgi:hypothetical protein
MLDYTVEIGIAGAKAPCEPVSTALGNSLAIGDHLKLTGLARRKHSFNAEPLLDEGQETRDLGFVVLSRGAGNYLDLHCVLQSAWCGRLTLVWADLDTTGLDRLSRNRWQRSGAATD